MRKHYILSVHQRLHRASRRFVGIFIWFQCALTQKAFGTHSKRSSWRVFNGHDTPVLRYHCRQCATCIRSNKGVTSQAIWMTMVQKISSEFVLKTVRRSCAVLETDAWYETPNAGSVWLCPTGVCFGSDPDHSPRYTHSTPLHG